MSYPASPDQVRFIKNLVLERQDTVAVPDVDEFVEILKIQRLTKTGASVVINHLLATPKDVVVVAPGEAAKGPANRFAGTCVNCGQRVGPGEGTYRGSRGAWQTLHHPGDENCVKPIEISQDGVEGSVTVEALEHDIVSVIEGNLTGGKAWAVANAKLMTFEGGSYCVPSVTGTNDFTFFEVAINQGRMNPANKGKRYFNHLVGGHNPEEMRVSPAFILKALLAAETMGIVEALRQYGFATRHCGRCGKDLTKKASRDTGFGRKCANDLGVEWAEDPNKTYADLDEVAGGE